ncbi:hypothetical protein NP493_6g10007 [Ridgeia piscesae]|uniref:C2 domain-containing protein n=1 Tax=Ridgeia piscesae TaxID=27915 RepID=A0AAD9PFM6_RIDPI|nr:hypothetical protein NP493_6g10007 [Ridgeia piscesae]
MSTVSASIEDMSADSLGDSMLLTQGPMPGRVRRRTSMQDALDFTKINAQLYEKETVPSPDPVTGKFGSINEEDNHGSINFSLSYSPEQGLLTVRLVQARDLVPCDFSGTADPYCRLCLLPNSKPQLQSKVHKKTLSPEFSEEFIFDIASSQLTSLTLEILIYDFDHFSRDECIGQIHLPLSGIDLSEKVTLWKSIAVYNQTELKNDDLGDVMLSLSYLTSAERLTVAVLKARNLHFPEEMKHTSNPFVKVTLSCPGKKPKKKKTSTIRNCMNPMWNEAIVFSLSRGMLADTIVEITVVNDNLLGANEPIGHVVIGSNTAGEELGHWNDMINSKTAMARWHHLAGFSADMRRGSSQ